MLRLSILIAAAVGISIATSSARAGGQPDYGSASPPVYCQGGHWVWTGGWGLLGPGWGYYLTPDYYYVPRRCYLPEAAVDYCMRRFRSYDPRTRTYLGYDGHRHPCP